jgi:hypothetical protein
MSLDSRHSTERQGACWKQWHEDITHCCDYAALRPFGLRARTLVPTKSDFAGQPVMQTGTVTINERQGDITVSRNFAYEGAGETYFYRDMTDGQNSATIHAGKDFKSKTKWDHDVLKVITAQNGATTVESYTLGADGVLMANVVSAGRKPITLYFERK